MYLVIELKKRSNYTSLYCDNSVTRTWNSYNSIIKCVSRGGAPIACFRDKHMHFFKLTRIHETQMNRQRVYWWVEYHWVSLSGFLNYAILFAFIFKRFHVHSSKIMHRSSREASVYHMKWLSCSYSLSFFKALKFGHTSMYITFISLKRWGFISANPCHLR